VISRTPFCRALLGAFACALVLSVSVVAQTNVPARALITTQVNEQRLVTLSGSVHPLAKKEFDAGAAETSQPAGRLLLQLKRPGERETALQSFLQDVHRTGSSSYHKWLTPQQFGQQFGVADSDLGQIKSWLQSHGLQASKVSAGRDFIEFSGTVGQVNETFHTEIHKFNIHGQVHYANAAPIQIPVALSGVVAGVTRVNDFHAQPQAKLVGQVTYTPKTHVAKPNWTYPGDTPFYLLAPEDFATQYNLKPVYAAGVTGTGQTIGIINESNIDISLVNAYRKIFSLSVNPPQVVIDGSDPGIVSGADTEAYLDVENAGAAAPDATVMLYIAAQDGIFGGGIDFSMLRAVDDDTASVLSLSFGYCESQGTAFNEFLNSVWEQAAAQGQTALVSAGDSGSTQSGCSGPAVSGFASTPWDIAVGGSDFYFADYASGGASIANYWSAANDSTFGSLLKPIPEQVWNGTQYGLNSITYDPVLDQPNNDYAGGGGMSSCVVDALDADGNVIGCASGYPKPSWQVGNGVPNDGVRDLPDLSLFASGGYNGVAWPICAQAGDCTQTDSSGTLFISDVGGTSASAPSMAGIMALVNQKYGPQGQANYTLYPLAAQFPTVFNPIDLGSNNVPCYYFPGEVGCSLDANGVTASIGEYSAGSGFDLASGLGSVDVNQLIQNWNKISFKTSQTTLSLTPASITHGQAITAKVAVTGTGTPTGAVALVSDSTLPSNQGQGYLQLESDGTGTGTITSLPGGTYNIYGQYSGDGINGASKSATVSITVAPEASQLLFSAYATANAVRGKHTLVLHRHSPIASARFIPQGKAKPEQQYPYGVSSVIVMQVVGASGVADGTPTGTITFYNGTTPLVAYPVSSEGTADFTGDTLPLGTYEISAAYSGDASYKPSTSETYEIQVVQDTTTAQFLNDRSASYNDDGSIGFVTGQNITMMAIIGAGSGGYASLPTGNVTFQLGSNPPVTVALATEFLPNYGNYAVAPVTFNNLAAGTQTLTMTYGGDVNFTGTTATQAIEVVAPTLTPTVTKLAITDPANLSTITDTTNLTITATVKGDGTTAPTGKIAMSIANFYTLVEVALTPGSNGVSTASFVTQPQYLPSGTTQLTAAYSGDSTNGKSMSSAIQVVYNTGQDFSLYSQTQNLVIASGSSGTATLSLSSIAGFNGAVNLTCNAPASLICTLNPATVALNGSATSTITVNTAIQKTAAANRKSPWSAAVGSAVLCLILGIWPVRRSIRYRKGWLGALAVAFLSVMMGTVSGCGGGGTKTVVTTPPVVQDAAKGNYTVVVSGTAASGTIHNVAITVVVQ
jgi:subtilase family serine protease